MELATLYAKIERLREEHKRAQERANKKKKALDAAVAELVAPLRAHCERAITIYNGLGGTQLRADALSVSVDQKNAKVYIGTRVGGRYEPDDEWDFDDEKRISTRYGEILDPILAGAGVALTFGGASFPPSYFMK